LLKKIRIPVHNKGSLREVADIHKQLEERRTTGCSILTP
jgi:hypothetical protein